MKTTGEETVWMQNWRRRRGRRRGTANRSRGSFTGRQCQQRGVWGSEGGSLPTTEPVFPPSYCRSKAKNYTCFIVSSFQGILWIWNFICLVSIHCVFSLKFQLLSVSRLGKYAKIYPNAVIIVLHAMSGPTTGSWKNEGWEGLLTVKITLASAR